MKEESQDKAMEQQQSQGTNAEQSSDSSQQQPQGDAQSARVAELEAQLAQARKEASDNWNKYLRQQAEWDNFRKRQERVVSDRVQQQKKTLFKNVLEVMDNVERALTYQETMDKSELQHILRMLQWQMNEVLRAEGLNLVPTVGETFNPYVHEAVEVVEDSDQPEGTILGEERKGYTLGEETLRPARVKVSMGNK